MSYVLVYFRGCPNAAIAEDLLNDVGLEYTTVCQDDLPAEHKLRAFTSPTLLEDGEIVFGSRNDGAQACSLDLPSERELLSRICKESADSDKAPES